MCPTTNKQLSPARKTDALYSTLPARWLPDCDTNSLSRVRSSRCYQNTGSVVSLPIWKVESGHVSATFSFSLQTPSRITFMICLGDSYQKSPFSPSHHRRARRAMSQQYILHGWAPMGSGPYKNTNIQTNIRNT